MTHDEGDLALPELMLDRADYVRNQSGHYDGQIKAPPVTVANRGPTFDIVDFPSKIET